MALEGSYIDFVNYILVVIAIFSGIVAVTFYFDDARNEFITCQFTYSEWTVATTFRINVNKSSSSTGTTSVIDVLALIGLLLGSICLSKVTFVIRVSKENHFINLKFIFKIYCISQRNGKN